MPRRTSLLDSMPRLGRITYATIGLLGVASLLAALAGGSVPLKEVALFEPEMVLHGQLWRLLTQAWIEPEAFGLIFGVWALAIFLPPLEREWGERRLLLRLLAFVAVPPILLTLLALPIPSLRDAVYLSIWPLVYCLIAAFACEMRGSQITLFPLPFQVNGDGLLLFEGGVLFVFTMYDRSLVPQLLSIVAFLFAIVWFRLGFVRAARRSWLRFRKRQLESRMARLRKGRRLRVVESDDDDEPRRLIH